MRMVRWTVKGTNFYLFEGLGKNSHDGHEVDIFRAGPALLNVATGAIIENAVGWRTLQIRDKKTDIR